MGVAQQRLGRGIEPLVLARRHDRGLDQRPQRARPWLSYCIDIIAARSFTVK
jgi:hypothetical protein